MQCMLTPVNSNSKLRSRIQVIAISYYIIAYCGLRYNYNYKVTNSQQFWQTHQGGGISMYGARITDPYSLQYTVYLY